MSTVLGPQIDTIERLESREVAGTVVAAAGLSLRAVDLALPVGGLVRLEPRGAARRAAGRERLRSTANGGTKLARVVSF